VASQSSQAKRRPADDDINGNPAKKLKVSNPAQPADDDMVVVVEDAGGAIIIDDD
jgi:hypothetical protein